MEYGETILPAGYFFARVGVTSLTQGMPEAEKDIKEPEMPTKDDEDQLAAYVYFKVWENVLLNMFPVNESFDEEFINVDVVVFGHTHNPAYRVYDGFDKLKVVVNEGT